MILIQEVWKESSWLQRSDVRTQYSQQYRSTVKADALKSGNFCWSDAGDFMMQETSCFPFQVSEVFPVDTMYEPRNWKSSTFSISSPSSWRLECGILQVISLVFVVSIHSCLLAGHLFWLQIHRTLHRRQERMTWYQSIEPSLGVPREGVCDGDSAIVSLYNSSSSCTPSRL